MKININEDRAPCGLQWRGYLWKSHRTLLVVLNNVDDLSLLFYAGEISRWLLLTPHVAIAQSTRTLKFLWCLTYSIQHLMSGIYCDTAMHGEKGRQMDVRGLTTRRAGQCLCYGRYCSWCQITARYHESLLFVCCTTGSPKNPTESLSLGGIT